MDTQIKNNCQNNENEKLFVFKDDITDLFQWSIGVTLIFNTKYSGEKVHFSNDKMKAYTRTIDRYGEVNIPDFLLQKANPLEVYIMLPTETGNYTKIRSIIRVLARPKPDGYVIDENEEEAKIWDTKLDIYQGTENTGRILTIDQDGIITNTDFSSIATWDNIVNKPDFKPISITGSYHDLIDKPFIPIKYSELINDNNTITDGNYVHTDNNFTTENKIKLNDIEAGAEVNIQSDWNIIDETSDAFIKNKPIKLSEFINDNNFVTDENYVHTDNNFTTEEKTKLSNIVDGAEVNVQADWFEVNNTNDAFIKNKPTKLSEFANDSAFIDNTVNNLINYYTKNEVANMVNAASTFKFKVVNSLPAIEDASSQIIYLIKKNDKWANDIFNEYLFVESANKFELIGNTAIDLTNYLQKNGDGSAVTIDFETAESFELPISGETTSIIVGKITKCIADLSNKPTVHVGFNPPADPNCIIWIDTSV